MSNKFNTGQFDKMLRQALKKHSEPVPADFTTRMMSNVEETSRQKMLAAVILRERLAIAACITVAVLTAVVAIGFPGVAAGVFDRVAAGLVDQSRAFIEGLPTTAKAVSGAWRFVAAIAAVVGFCIYGLIDSLFGDRLRLL
jgi:hypothetical protein